MNRQQSAEATRLVSEYARSHPYEPDKALAVRFGLTPTQIRYILVKTGLQQRKRRAVVDPFEQGEWKFFPSKQKGAGQ